MYAPTRNEEEGSDDSEVGVVAVVVIDRWAKAYQRGGLRGVNQGFLLYPCLDWDDHHCLRLGADLNLDYTAAPLRTAWGGVHSIAQS